MRDWGRVPDVWAYQPGVGWHLTSETYPSEAVVLCTGGRVHADYFCSPHPRNHLDLAEPVLCPACVRMRATPGDGGEE